MLPSTIAQYRILGEIGAGGMGKVFKAEDPRLKRTVAIKIISPSATGIDPAATERFVKEAQNASALDHQNICTIHEINETPEGELYLVMAYYDGQTLRELIKGGTLTLSTSIDIARQILAGLGRAHETGIVHRDVKPSNVILTRHGDVKLVDFGLAKLVGEAPLTSPGGLIGTFPYMSPEQCNGEEVDGRSDLWSAGIVLYEMLTGRRPFRAPGVAVMAKIVRDDPESILGRCPGAPPKLDAILRRSLAKKASDRYQNAKQFIHELDQCVGRTPSAITAVAPTSWSADPADLDTLSLTVSGSSLATSAIAVLPFANLSGDAANDYLSDGLTDEIITDLSMIAALRVTSRTSVMQLKDSRKDVPTIGRELNVSHVLEGSVRKLGSRLRVTTKIISVHDDATLWAEKFDGSTEDIFEIQERISLRVAEALRLELSSKEEARIAERPINDIQAYECYLRAKHEVFRFTREGLESALTYLERASSIASDNVLILAATGYVYWQSLNAGLTSDVGCLDKAEECARKIQQLEPGSGHAERLLGLVAMHRGDPQGVVLHLQKALDSNPNDTDAMTWLLFTYGFTGKSRERDKLLARLLQIDPLTPTIQCLPGFLAMMDGDYEESLEPLGRGAEMDLGNPAARLVYGHMLAATHRMDECVRTLDELYEEMPDNFFSRLGRVIKHAFLRQPDEARSVMTEDVTATAHADPQYSWIMAQCHVMMEDGEAAIEWLENAVEHGFVNYPLLSERDPFLADLRASERFTNLMTRVEERWRAFEV